MKLKTFWGGVHPPGKKHFTGQGDISLLKAPDQVVVPLGQHIGAPAKPLVKKGESVLAGQRIGEATGTVSAHVHSPVSGTVAAVETRPHSSGYSVLAVVIDNDGRDNWVEFAPCSEPLRLSAAEIKERVGEAGVVGLGGATFPTAIKLSPPADQPFDFFIINASECEPYLTADQRIMVERAEDVVLGARLLAKACGAKRLLIGVENNKLEAYRSLQAAAGNIDVVLLATKYPQGGEKQLIKTLTGREVPRNGLPFQCGVVVQNIGTALAAAYAVRDGRPLTHRAVTVSGEGVTSPQNFWAPIGASFQYLVDAAGGLTAAAGKVLAGGPMMGKAQWTLDVPVDAGTTGILVLTASQAQLPEASVCIKCSRCADVCPTYLLPMQIERVANVGNFDEARQLGALDCIECGSCSYICPSKRYLLQYIRLAKQQIGTSQTASS